MKSDVVAFATEAARRQDFSILLSQLLIPLHEKRGRKSCTHSIPTLTLVWYCHAIEAC